MKRRAAIEPIIGHLKQERRLNRNRLKATQGKPDEWGVERGRDEFEQAAQACGSYFAPCL